jgi:hypothetical protein
LSEDRTYRQGEPDDEHDEHPGGKSEKSQKYAAPDEARTDAETHVSDQPIPSSDEEGVGEPAGTEAGQSPHRSHLYDLLVHQLIPSTHLTFWGFPELGLDPVADFEVLERLR